MSPYLPSKSVSHYCQSAGLLICPNNPSHITLSLSPYIYLSSPAVSTLLCLPTYLSSLSASHYFGLSPYILVSIFINCLNITLSHLSPSVCLLICRHLPSHITACVCLILLVTCLRLPVSISLLNKSICLYVCLSSCL